MRRKVIPYGSSRMRTMVAKQILNVDWTRNTNKESEGCVKSIWPIVFVIAIVVVASLK